MGGNWLLALTGMAWTGLTVVSLAIQVACLVHVIRTGRPLWWLWVVFMFPFVGILAYLWLEIRPSLGRQDWQSILWRLKSSAERIRILEANLEESSTIKNRFALADELHAAGQFDRECEVLEEGLRGAFKDDCHVLMRLAQAHLEAGRAEVADRHLQAATPERSPDVQLQHALLRCRIDAALGRADEAVSGFQDLVGRKRSEAPRYYYAEFLCRQGRTAEAKPILKDILHQYRRGTVVWRYQERRWFQAAKRLLRAPPATTAEPLAMGAQSG